MIQAQKLQVLGVTYFILQTFLVDRDPRILQFTVDLQYCRIFFCTAGRARAQISEILRTL